jgi:alpha-glucosidase
VTPLPWWRSGAVYQIYPRSYLDASGDGVGDLEGIRRRLDHVADLGAEAIWLSPIYRSPMADFGYDVSDHTAIDPVFGDLATFDALVAAAHALGLRVLLDWVPNHTSSEHPWFVEARSSRASPKRDWYVWRDGRDGGPPNNWHAAFGGRAWTWDERTGQWYLHLFLPEQPDVNWENPEVVAAQHDVLRFWLDRGVDGFRADVVHLIGKDPALEDLPDDRARDVVGTHDHPSTHALLRGIRGVLDAYEGERAMVGEVQLHGPERLAPYYGRGDELHLVFDFALLRAPWDAGRWAAVVTASEAALAPVGGWPAWVLSNHDEPRHRTRYGGSEERARVAALVLLTLRGTPFLYAGEELGLVDADVPREHRFDPGGRDGCRAPVPWDATPLHGWAAEPWLPWAPEAGARNVERQGRDADSILGLYRRLLRARRSSPALHAGEWRLLETPPGTLAYERAAGDDRRRVLANFEAGDVEVRAEPAWEIEVATRVGREGVAWDGRLGPLEAVVLRPPQALPRPHARNMLYATGSRT